MTALQWIIKEAKSLKSKYPKRFAKWTEYVAQASAIYASKHKGISPVGKKKVAKKVVRKKASKKRVGKIEFLNVPAFKGKELESMKKGFAEYINEKRKRQSKKKIVKKSAKKVGTIKKRKLTERAVLKSIQNAVKVQKSHMGGISGHALHNIDKELKQIKHLESLIRSNEIAKKNTKDSKAKKAMSNSIKKYKELMKEHKIHITQLKKHIK